jgi:hypothetical protein
MVRLTPVPCQNSVLRLVSWSFGVGSGGSSVFVDHSVEDLVPVDWRVGRRDEGGVVVGRAVLASLVWPVIVEMPEVLVKDDEGVNLVSRSRIRNRNWVVRW